MMTFLMGLKNNMTVALFLVVLTMAGLLLASRGENKRLADATVLLNEKLDEISITLDSHTVQFQNLSTAVAALQTTQDQLDTRSRELHSFIDEIANEKDRATDPFWDAFFERLRSDDSTSPDREPEATVP